MKLSDKVIVVTGGARGIGRALCRRFAAEGARAVVVADVDAAGAEEVAREIGGLAVATDVRREADIKALVDRAISTFGDVHVFFSNAGIGMGGGVEVPDGAWQRIWEINVMSHVWAARAVLPGMLSRGEGYLLSTASAAGLLSNPGAAPYAVTKHAAVALAEWLALTYGDKGIRVSCLCPQGVDTDLLRSAPDALAIAVVRAAGRVISPEEVAEVVVRDMDEEKFLILPHPEVAAHWQKKAADPDKWLAGIRRLQAMVTTAGMK